MPGATGDCSVLLWFVFVDGVVVAWRLGLLQRCDGGCHDYNDADGDGGDLVMMEMKILIFFITTICHDAWT